MQYGAGLSIEYLGWFQLQILIRKTRSIRVPSEQPNVCNEKVAEGSFMVPEITVSFYSTYGANHGDDVEAARATDAAEAEERLRVLNSSRLRTW
jgi:hypothetical protein